MGLCEITVDSGAEESVWLRGWLREEPTARSRPEAKRFVAASGQEMDHCGSKTVKFLRQGRIDVRSLGFEARDMPRPTGGVRRPVEKSNEVRFGEDGEWIHNVARGSKIPLERSGGCYLLRVKFIADTASFS